MQLGFGPGHIVLAGDTVPLPKGLMLRISKLDRMRGALPVIASFVALELQIMLVKTRSESV